MLFFPFKICTLFVNEKIKCMSVVKVIEIMSSSDKSWEDASIKGVEKASKTLKKIKSAWVQDQSIVVKDNQVTEFRVTLKLSFELE